MQRHFDDELHKLNTNLLKMASLSEEAIHRSLEALKGRDKKLAQSVIDDDAKIDALENMIDEEGIDLLALFQPMARDLRLITTAMKINAELERIADLCVNISQRTLEIADQPLLKPLIDIPKLAENAKKMVKNSIDAFVNKDKILAREVILSDKVSNDLRNHIMQELVDNYMTKDGSTAPRAIALLLMTRDFERISDHAKNIAEDVIYIVEAKVVKHHFNELGDLKQGQ